MVINRLEALLKGKNGFKFNSTELDDDLAIDIQDAVGKMPSLSKIANNIIVTVEDDAVTLVGEVNFEREKSTIEDIAQFFVEEGHVNNYLKVINTIGCDGS